MSVLTGSARKAAISFAGAISAAVLGFALTVVVGRGLGPTGAGLFFTVAAIFFVLSNVMELGADTTLLWDLSRMRAHRRFGEMRTAVEVAMIPVWVASIASGLAVFFCAGPLAAVFFADHQAQGTLLLQVIAPIVMLGSPLTVAMSGTRGLGSIMAFTGIVNVGIPALRPALILLVLALGIGGAASVTAVVAAWSLPIVLGCVAGVVILIRMLENTERRAFAGPDAADLPEPRPRRVIRREFWAYSRPRGVSAMLEIGLVWADVLMLSALAGPREAGIYAAASRFVTTGTLAEAALRVALSPKLSELLALGKVHTAGRLTGIASVWITAVSWPLYLTLATFSPFVLHLFGAQFAEGATALTVLSLAMGVAMTAGNVQTVLLMSGRSLWQMLNKLVALGLDVGLCALLIPRFGMVGAAYAWAAAILVDTALAVWQVRYKLGVRATVGGGGSDGDQPVVTADSPGGWWQQKLTHVARHGWGLALVGAAAALCFGAWGVVMRFATDASAVGFMVYLGVAVPVFVVAMWGLRPVLGLEAVAPGLEARLGRLVRRGR